MKNSDVMDYLLKTPNRTPLTIMSQFTKALENKYHDFEDVPIMKEKTSRNILIYLAYHNGAPQRDLARITQTKNATITSVLGKLEERGLVVRRNNEFDMRSIRVFITKKGLEVEGKIEKILKDMEAKVTKGLSPREIRDLEYMLEVMLNNLF